MIKKLRKEIDTIDGNILKLLKKRVKVCKEIGRTKNELIMEIVDRKREEEVLKRSGTFKPIFKEIIKTCRKVQK